MFLEDKGTPANPHDSMHSTDLLRPINQADQFRLSRLISSQEHILPIFVHPFFTMYRHGIPALYYSFAKKRASDEETIYSWVDSYFSLKLDSQRADKKDRTKEYLAVFMDWLSSNPQTIIALAEEEDRIEMSIKILRTQGFWGEIVYYPTWPSNPQPRYEDYNYVVRSLFDLDVKHLQFGGQRGKYPKGNTQDLTLHTASLPQVNIWQYSEQFGKECVAHFVSGMARGIQGEVANQHIGISPIETIAPLRVIGD